jgi:predicted Rossmann fold flavoprotein
MRDDFDVVVIGAGAAGMMCAAQAGQRGRRVLLIEHYHTLGEKIRISGGGRCNFTNTGASAGAYLSQNPDYCRSALARYSARDFIALVERHGIAYHEKKLGQLFCDDTAHDIIAMLKAECDRGGVEWRMPCAVGGVENVGGSFAVTTAEGTFRASSLVIATGGLTVPKIGATPFGYQVAAQFGLAVVPPRPALVPLAFAPEWLERYGDLAGVSLDVEASCNGGDFARTCCSPIADSRARPSCSLVVLGRQVAALDRPLAGRGSRRLVPGSAHVDGADRQRAGATAVAALRRRVVRRALTRQGR